MKFKILALSALCTLSHIETYAATVDIDQRPLVAPATSAHASAAAVVSDPRGHAGRSAHNTQAIRERATAERLQKELDQLNTKKNETLLTFETLLARPTS